MGETAARNGHDVGDTPCPFLPPSADAVQVQGNGEHVTVPSAEAPVGDVADSNQPSSTRGEITGSIPGASATLTEISGSANVADPVEPCSSNVQAAGDVATLATKNDPCGWCGSTEVSPLDSTQGRIHCQACHAVYNPRTGWEPGDRDKQQRPPASLPATAA
jgi:hypothetical protein